MRTLKIVTHLSLDGVMQTTNDGDNDFPYGDWTAAYRTPEGRDLVTALHGTEFDLILGRRTYDSWSQFWPKARGVPIGERIDAAKKYVATHRPESLAWGPHEALGSDVLEGIRRIKAEEGPSLVISGSASLTSTVLAAGLADEVVLIVYPVLLGTGKRFFAEGTPACTLRLTDARALPSGVVLNTYKTNGLLKAG